MRNIFTTSVRKIQLSLCSPLTNKHRRYFYFIEFEFIFKIEYFKSELENQAIENLNWKIKFLKNLIDKNNLKAI